MNEQRERYSLEVSSPGLRAPADEARSLPPLRRTPRAGAHPTSAPGRRTPTRPAALAGDTAFGQGGSFTGELVGASEEEITLAAEEGVVAIPYAEIRRSNLVEE